MLPEVTYTFYSEDYSGALSEPDFDRSLSPAVAQVRYIIGFNVPSNERQIEAYKRAVCAAVDVDYALGQTGGVGGDLASLSIGSFSASAADGSADNSEISYDREMARVIRHELVATGLLYQGIG